MLKVSFCDTGVSGVRHPSSVVRQHLVCTLEATVLVQMSSNLVRMIALMNSRTSSNLGHVGSKTRSLGQILEIPCVHSRGHIFGPKVLIFGQDDCPDELSNKFESGSCGVKN